MAYGAVMQALRTAGGARWTQTLGFLSNAQDDMLEGSLIMYNVTMGSLGRTAGSQWARCRLLLEELSRMQLQPDVVTYNSAISAQAALWRQALALQAEMRPTNQPGNTITFNSACNSLSKSAAWRRALDQFIEAAVTRTAPDLVMINTLTSACKSEWSKGLTLLELAGAQQVHDAFTHVASISSFESAARWQQALGILSCFGARRLRPNTIAYNATGAAHDAGEQWLQSMALLREQKVRQLFADIVSYGSVISSCEGSAQWHEALSILRGCEVSSGPKPDLIAYNAGISACRGRQWHLALALLYTKGLQGHLISRNAAISACASRGQWEHALLLLFESRQQVMQTDIVAHSAAISSCETGLLLRNLN